MLAVLACTAQAHAADGVCAEASLLSAQEPLLAAPQQPDEPLRDEELPWCTNADDPRCAPLPGHAPASHDLGRGCAGTLSAVPTYSPRHPPHAVHHTACAGLPQAEGTRLRLERPPRA